MKNKLALVVSISLVLLSFFLPTGCRQPMKVQPEPNEPQPVSAHFLAGLQATKNYIAGNLADYRLIIMLHSIESAGRNDFLAGFVEAFSQTGKREDGNKYAKVLEGAVTGSQFETAREMGAKHAQRLVTNSQIQDLIHGSIGLSGSIALGWKAGYIEGFKTQRVLDKHQGKIPNEQVQEELYKEAAATYNALRAATGR
jgi:hypothetical protein